MLRRQLESAQQRGYTFYVAPQIEYFYFRAPDDPSPLDSGGYFDLSPLDTATDLRRETVLTLEEMGIGVESSHHEAAPSQHEIDLRYTDALTMADQVMTTRLVVKEVAIKQGVHATFMPKPLNGVNGSGMHVYLSLFDHEQNLFYEEGGGLSEIARAFLAGLLAYTPQFTLIANQWSNSYKRLAPGTEAPVYLTWSHANQSDLVRIPDYEPGDSESTRLEYRGADSATNPYLAFSAFLAAGLRGIDEGLIPPPAAEDNVFELTPAQREGAEHRRDADDPGSRHRSVLEIRVDEECVRRVRLVDGAAKQAPRVGRVPLAGHRLRAASLPGRVVALVIATARTGCRYSGFRARKQ